MTKTAPNPCHAINAEMRAVQGVGALPTGAYIDVRDLGDAHHKPKKTCHAINAEMQARQGKRVSATGVYIDVHELADTELDEVLRRIYAFILNPRSRTPLTD